MRIKRYFPGGVKVIQMVGKSNLILLIPTGDDLRYSAETVLLWDDKKLKSVGDIKFASEALSVIFAKDLFMVAQRDQLKCLTMKDIKVMTTIPTNQNLKGLQAVSYGNEFCIATPHTELGKV